MARTAMILGPTGSGKTFGIKGLDPKTTFIITPFKTHLAWKGGRKHYIEMIPPKAVGNFIVSDKFNKTLMILKKIGSGVRFKTVIIDDLQFLQGFRAIETSGETGYTKFCVTAEKYLELFKLTARLRDDLTIFFLTQTEVTPYGITRARIGSKFVEEVSGNLESFFDVVVGAGIDTSLTPGDELYGYYQTRKEGEDTLKTPYEMFDDERIPNNLETLRLAMIAYEEDE